jgi:hypothetical protein
VRNNYFMKSPQLILLLISFMSCTKTNEKCKDVSLNDYSINITFSSFFACGLDERIVLTSLPGPLTYREKFKLDQLYKINVKDNCTKPLRDTLMIKVSKIQRDSIFDLANRYVENVKFNIHIKSCEPYIVTKKVMDGGNVQLALCFQNQCKTTSFYHYGHLEDVSTDLVNLMNYIDRLK